MSEHEIRMSMQFHILSFEGPDGYSLAGGLGTRVMGLTEALSRAGEEVHLWFVGDPDLSGHEAHGSLHLHRWCQWLSKHHRGGVYDGDEAKAFDYGKSVAPYLLEHVLGPHLRAGGRATILAEEWQTVSATLELDRLLRARGLRKQVTIAWNANNTFGFHLVDFPALGRAATITTVSRYMRHCMHDFGVEAVVIPNGLPPDAFQAPDGAAVRRLRHALRDRVVLTKMARWDPDKRWLSAVSIAAEMRRKGLRPLLIARGGREPHGEAVLSAAAAQGLKVVERVAAHAGPRALVDALERVGDADVINLRSHVDPDSRRVLFRASNVVLANSRFEPFGLVGLEAMAVGGIACIGCTGEDYGVPGHNALMLQTNDPAEFLSAYDELKQDPARAARLRRAGRTTAQHYAWPEIIEQNLKPWLSLAGSIQAV
jgi:glycosyltransferase involved in cell wall biosynthesis